MKRIILDGRKMINTEITHGYLADKLQLPSYYGNNLDALWDILSTVSEPIKICLINKDKLLENLKDYGQEIIKTFYDASVENSNIIFNIIIFKKKSKVQEAGK